MTGIEKRYDDILNFALSNGWWVSYDIVVGKPHFKCGAFECDKCILDVLECQHDAEKMLKFFKASHIHPEMFI